MKIKTGAKLLASLMAATLVLSVGMSSNALAQAKRPKTTPQEKSPVDGWGIQMTYYPAKGDPGGTPDAPVVVLLSGIKESRLVWDKKYEATFVDPLREARFAVITVDLRKQGGSATPPMGMQADAEIKAVDFNNMVGDLEAVKRLIFQKHQAKELNMRKMAIVGVEETCAVAAAFAELDWNKEPFDDAGTPDARTPRGQDVRALVFLSPTAKGGDISLSRQLGVLKAPANNMGFFFAVGKKDKADKGQVKQMYTKIAPKQDKAKEKDKEKPAEKKKTDEKKLAAPEKSARIYLAEFNSNLRGSKLMEEENVPKAIILWLSEHVSSISDPWADRRSRIER